MDIKSVIQLHWKVELLDVIDDYLKQTTFKIVGTCNTPGLFKLCERSSTIGSGSVDTSLSWFLKVTM